MGRYFEKIYLGAPFELFEFSHLIVLALVVGINAAIIMGKKNITEKARQRTRLILAVLLLITQSAWIAWLLYIGEADLDSVLPLDICSFFIILSTLMLLLRNYSLYEFCFFMGSGGALSALITPDIGFYRFPHFFFIQTMLAHALLLTAQVYMTAVEGFRPTWRSLLKVIAGVNFFMLLVGFANHRLGSNYLFLARKPEAATILDMFGPWPWYIFEAELLGFLLCALVVFLFSLSSRKNASLQNNTAD